MVSTFGDERPKHDESIRHHDHWSWSLHHGRYKQLPTGVGQRYAVSTSQAAHVPIRCIGHCASQRETICPQGSQLHSNRDDEIGVRYASDDWRCHIFSPQRHRGVWPLAGCNHGPSFRMALGQGRTQRKGQLNMLSRINTRPHRSIRQYRKMRRSNYNRWGFTIY